MSRRRRGSPRRDLVAITPNLYSRGGMGAMHHQVFRELLTRRGRALDDISRRPRSCAVHAGVHRRCRCASGSAWAVNSRWYGAQGFGASAPFYGTPLPRHLSDTLDGACPIVPASAAATRMACGAAARLRKVVDDKGIDADITGLPGRRPQLREQAAGPAATPDRRVRLQRMQRLKTPTAASSHSSTSTLASRTAVPRARCAPCRCRL